MKVSTACGCNGKLTVSVEMSIEAVVARSGNVSVSECRTNVANLRCAVCGHPVNSVAARSSLAAKIIGKILKKEK